MESWLHQSRLSAVWILTYVLAIHVVVEGEAVGGAVGVHVEGGGQETGLVPVLARPRRLDVHVETCGGVTTRSDQSTLKHTWLLDCEAPQTRPLCDVDGQEKIK